MEKTNLYIPKKCKVGLQQREGTYTGKLGYVIYHDGKVWRKQASWEGWRHKEGQKTNKYDPTEGKYIESFITGVEPIEFENVPTEGFVLNKKAGGYSSGWNHRQTYCRVYDPRGFEFEITIPNLLYILQECSAYKGKGLEGEFVYSWEGKDLVLLPVSSPDYKECQVYTELQTGKVYKKDLVEGCTYLTSKMEKLVYLGQHNVCEDVYYARTDIENDQYGNSSKGSFEKKHVFRTEAENVDEYSRVYEFLTSLGRLKSKVSDDIDPRFPEFIDELQKSENYSEPDHLEIVPLQKTRGRNDVFEYYYNSTIYKFSEIKRTSDLAESVRTLRRAKEDGKWEVCLVTKVKRTTSYWSSDYYDTVLVPEGTFTKEEVMENYGMLCRVYKNGFKKII